MVATRPVLWVGRCHCAFCQLAGNPRSAGCRAPEFSLSTPERFGCIFRLESAYIDCVWPPAAGAELAQCCRPGGDMASAAHARREV